ncbi:MAG: hypothetical protein ACMXYD_03055 [Candidatus Woesearchaeota archaeon]
MKLEVLQQNKQPSFERTIIVAKTYTVEATPSRQVLANALAKHLSAPRDLVIVSRIDSSFGGGAIQVHARVYTSEEAMKRLEEAVVVEKNKLVAAEEPEAAEEPASEETASKDAEEPEAAEEEKTE